MTGIGKKIRALRSQKKLTLQALAELTNLSKGYLSKIERSNEAPRLPTLQLIAGALEVEVNEFFEDSREQTLVSHNLDLMKQSDRNTREMLTSTTGYSYQSLVHSSRGKFMVPYMLKIKQGRTSVFTHDSEEFIYVVSGKVTLFYEGKEYELEAGDSFYIDSRLGHRFLNPHQQEAVLLNIIYDYKRF